MAKDLFGEIPVTKSDIRSWLKQHTQIDPDAPRAEYYVKHYNVAEKIRAEKLRSARLAAKPRTPRI